jgi:acetyl-CoA carboxylase carboxyltransferase component
MTAVPSTTIDPRSARFKANRDEMQVLLDAMLDGQARVLHGDEESYVAHQREGSGLSVRQRIDLLLDRDSPFLELAPLAGWGTDDPLGGALVVGLGIVEGIECLVSADDPEPTARSAGSSRSARSGPSPTAITKAIRAHEIALGNRLPFIVLTGATTPVEPAVRDSLARLVDARVPVITVAFGSSPIDAITRGRLVLRRLNWHKLGPGPVVAPHPPRLDPEDLLGVTSVDLDPAVDGREIIWRIADGSRFDELTPSDGPISRLGSGSPIVTGWASVCGFAVGIVAGTSRLGADDCDQGARFVQQCNRRDLPLLFIHNGEGFVVVDQDAHRAGALEHAVAESTVPHIVLRVGSTPNDGAEGSSATLSGDALHPRFTFSWPDHRLAAPADTGGHRRDDGIIDPRDTRTVIGIALSCVHSAAVRGAGSYGGANGGARP